jgi:GntP family gluconate:H+ symporter
VLHPGVIFTIGLAVLVAVTWRLKLPLPFGLVIFAVIAALLAGFGIPFRHLVEGSFGYINLVLALFAGAFFGQSMRLAGATDGLAAHVVRILGSKTWLVLTVSGVLLFLVGMFVGVAGVAVLATGVFVVPLLRRIGMPGDRIAAFIAVLATCGMIAPPVNVPAMTIADGVNMPFTNFELPLLVLSVIPALFSIVLFSLRRYEAPAMDTVTPPRRHAATAALVGLAATLGFWTLLRLFPEAIPDPAVPIVLIVGSLAALPLLGRSGIVKTIQASFSGTPLVLAAVLVAVGIAVQIMTLTGIRGWLVITSMSLPSTSTFIELIVLPLFGSLLTSVGAANVIGVPFAFAFIHQDMIINVASLSAIAALSEFMPPTAIATALATYIVGDTSVFRVLRHCIWPVVVIAAIAVAMLAFADQLAGIFASGAVAFRH